ncbi:hypothetical protein A3C17_02630 [Candidatus Uhrbacteria bacterium RIFCSPHIGHO2_02_FULL_53_13]|nr:MAG: hypothetical protein A3C17_02630 [Candidatus Uhrbacteria bacterium RIFCSPHIGHO2_02_FULL_53_13]
MANNGKLIKNIYLWEKLFNFQGEVDEVSQGRQDLQSVNWMSLQSTRKAKTFADKALCTFFVLRSDMPDTTEFRPGIRILTEYTFIKHLRDVLRQAREQGAAKPKAVQTRRQLLKDVETEDLWGMLKGTGERDWMSQPANFMAIMLELKAR